MTETEKWMRQYYADRAAREALALGMFERNKAAIMPLLAQSGIATVELAYDGMCDSGCIEAPICFDAENNVLECPALALEIEEFAPGLPQLTRTSKPLAEALEAVVYDALEVHHPGWEINEGAFGTFRIDVATSTMTLCCSVRTSHYHEDEIGEAL